MSEFPELHSTFPRPGMTETEAALVRVELRARHSSRSPIRPALALLVVVLSLAGGYTMGRRIGRPAPETNGTQGTTVNEPGAVVMRAPAFLTALSVTRSPRRSGRSGERYYEFHLWQIEPDGSRFSAGGVRGGGTEGYDVRLWVKPDRRIAGNGDYRLDADFVVHWLGDTSALIGEVDAIREVHHSTAPGDSVTRAHLEEETYRRSVALVPWSSAWFYPFGVPRSGERGVGFEITVAESMSTAPIPFEAGHSFLLSGRAYGAEFGPRLHRARLHIEVGTPASGWREVFDGLALTRVPVRVRLAREIASGRDLLLELEDPEWRSGLEHHDSLCWHWSWIDRQPPGGGSCAAANGGVSVQRLYGSEGGQLRVTVLSAE
jgi:hypothetical protein